MTNRVYISHEGLDWETVQDVAMHVVGLGAKLAGWDVGGQEQLFVGSAQQQIAASEVALVLLTEDDRSHARAANDVSVSIEHGKGIVAVLLSAEATIPQAVFDAGAEVLNWEEPEDVAYLGRAITVAEKASRILARAAQQGSGSGAPCARPRTNG